MNPQEQAPDQASGKPSEIEFRDGDKDAPESVIRSGILETLSTVYDPEIPVDIYQLGLIYEIDIKDDQFVDVMMTLTSPMCPVAGSLPPEVEMKIAAVEGVAGATVEVTWDPPWSPEMMSESARLELGFDL